MPIRNEDEAIDGEIEPEFVLEVVQVLCYEMDESQAAVVALRHIWGMDDLQIINHTGFAEAEVRRLASTGMSVLMNRLFTEE